MGTRALAEILARNNRHGMLLEERLGEGLRRIEHTPAGGSTTEQ